MSEFGDAVAAYLAKNVHRIEEARKVGALLAAEASAKEKTSIINESVKETSNGNKSAQTLPVSSTMTIDKPVECRTNIRSVGGGGRRYTIEGPAPYQVSCSSCRHELPFCCLFAVIPKCWK
jgi:hypothetical protein